MEPTSGSGAILKVVGDPTKQAGKRIMAEWAALISCRITRGCGKAGACWLCVGTAWVF